MKKLHFYLCINASTYMSMHTSSFTKCPIYCIILEHFCRLAYDHDGLQNSETLSLTYTCVCNCIATGINSKRPFNISVWNNRVVIYHCKNWQCFSILNSGDEILAGLFCRMITYLFWTCNQGCQMAYFQTKNSNLGSFCRVSQWKMLVSFMDIWPILQPFFMFYVWLFGIFSRFGMLYHEYSGNPAWIVLVGFGIEMVCLFYVEELRRFQSISGRSLWWRVAPLTRAQNQGDQIGRIFTNWTIVYFCSFLKIKKVDEIFGKLFSADHVM
jgi:hypothetical protein